MKAEFVVTEPYDDQKPGTSGLRKPTKRFVDNKYYTENFIQVNIFIVLFDNRINKYILFRVYFHLLGPSWLGPLLSLVVMVATF